MSCFVYKKCDSVQGYLHVYMYMITQTLERERKTKQHKTTQQRPETTFSKEKAAFMWDSNPRLTYSRHDAPPTELLRQLSWLSLKKHLYKPRQSKAKRASQPDNRWIQTCACTCYICTLHRPYTTLPVSTDKTWKVTQCRSFQSGTCFSLARACSHICGCYGYRWMFELKGDI